jgi:PhzF family phenazine biosynthesis protein
MIPLAFRLVDVFATSPLSGNGLTVIATDEPLDSALMQALAVELRQFETIFLFPTDQPRHFKARVFTMEEELDFAGHPVIGAAAVLHEAAEEAGEIKLTIELSDQRIPVRSRRTPAGFEVCMLQRPPLLGIELAPADQREFVTALGLLAGDRDAMLPMQVVSTGLPYLLVPVTPAGLERGRVMVDDLEARLAGVGAKFVYLLDAQGREGRTWDNLGRIEDVATGSAAGPAAAYLVTWGLAEAETEIILRQGRFTGRPSEMRLRVKAAGSTLAGVELTGSVQMIAKGAFDPTVTNQM